MQPLSPRTKTYLMVLGVTLAGAVACFVLLGQINKLQDDSEAVANLPFRRKEIKTPVTNQNESFINESLSLKVGQSYIFGKNGSTFKLVSVNDSRCPADPKIACVWAGTVTAKVEVSNNKTLVGIKEVEMNKTSIIGNYSINLVEVIPSVKNTDTQTSEYLLKFKIKN